jgi:uncharacterized FlgJ-related protein
MKNSMQKSTGVLIIILTLLIVISRCAKTNYTKEESKIVITKLVRVESNPTFTKKKLIVLIKELNLKFPEIVLAQTILETGNYSSSIFKENNNLFGMKEAQTRIHLAKGTKKGHAYYNNWKESVYDYSFYQATYMTGKSKRQYYSALSRSYAEDPTYITKLKQIVKKLKS